MKRRTPSFPNTTATTQIPTACAPEDSAQVTTELRDKIKSKMDVTKFFAAAISLLIGILLKEGQTASVRSRVGVIFFVSSLGSWDTSHQW